MAHTRPDFVVEHIRENPDNTVAVTFHVDGEPVEVTVDRSVPVFGLFKKSPKFGRSKAGDQWVGMYEKGYAEQFGMGEQYEGIGHGGSSAEALERLTGAESRSEYTSSFDLNDPADRQMLVDMLSNGDSLPTVAATPPKEKQPWWKSWRGSEAKGPVGKHAYTILGTHEEGGIVMVDVRNPWGSSYGEYGEDFSMPLEEFAKTFSRVDQNQMPAGPGRDGQIVTPRDEMAAFDQTRRREGYGDRTGPVNSPDLWRSSSRRDSLPLGYAVSDRARAEGVARRLAAGNMSAVADLGMREPRYGTMSPQTAYGVGRRADGTYVVIRGELTGKATVAFEAGITPISIVEPPELARGLTNGEMPVSAMDDAARPDRAVLLPSRTMADVVLHRGLDEFTFQTGFEYVPGEGGGTIVNGTAPNFKEHLLGSGGNSPDTVGIVLGRPELVGHDAAGLAVHKVKTELRVADGTSLWTGEVYVSENAQTSTEPPAGMIAATGEAGTAGPTRSNDGFNETTGRMDRRYRDLASDPAQYEQLQRTGKGIEDLNSFVDAADAYLAARDRHNQAMDRLFANEASIDEVTTADRERMDAEKKLAEARGKVDRQVGEMKQGEAASRRERLGPRPEEPPPPDVNSLALHSELPPGTLDKLEGSPALERFREAVAERDLAASQYQQVEWDMNYDRAGHDDPRTFDPMAYREQVHQASTRFRDAMAMVESRGDVLRTYARKVEARERWVQQTDGAGGLDTGRIARDGATKINDMYARPDAEMAMKTRGLVDYRVGRVESRYRDAGYLGNSDFSFNFSSHDLGRAAHPGGRLGQQAGRRRGRRHPVGPRPVHLPARARAAKHRDRDRGPRVLGPVPRPRPAHAGDAPEQALRRVARRRLDSHPRHHALGQRQHRRDPA